MHGNHRSSSATAVLAALAAVALVAAALVLPVGAVSADGNEAPGAPAATRSLSLGDTSSCAIVSDLVKCWGSNAYGQLGLGDTANRGISGGEMGNALPTVALGGNRTVTALAAGAQHVCARLDNAKVRCWGRNDSGQLGLGDTANRGDGPGEMGNNLPTVNLGTGRTAVALTAGDAHTCAILDTGKVKCWGNGGDGRLGSGATTNVGDGPNEMGDDLSVVPLGTGYTAIAIAAGAAHTCALLANGTVKCWGAGLFGRLGQGNPASIGDGPQEMGNNLPAIALGTGTTATAITAGDLHTCALMSNGLVKCWGASSGQATGDTVTRGDSPGEMGNSLPYANLGVGRTVVDVSAGGSHTCAVLDTGSVKCWGVNATGALGLGDTAPRGYSFDTVGDNLPTVDLGSGHTARAVVASSGSHTCARLDDGSLRCWGSAFGLGLGGVDNRGDGPGEMGDALPPVDLGTVGATGVVGTVECDTIPFGGPVAGAFVVAMRTTDFALEAGAVADVTGFFSLDVPAGNHFLYVIDPRGSCTAGFYGGPDVVAVSQGAVTTADPSLSTTTGQILGTVKDRTTTSPVAGAWALAFDLTGQLERVAVSTPTNSYFLNPLAPGNHYLAWLDPTGGHELRFHPDSPSLPGSLTQPVTAGHSTVVQPTLPPTTPVGGGAALTGAVTDELTGAPLAGAGVVALDASTFGFVRAGLTAADGTYALDVAPGDYKVIFLDPAGAHLPEWHADRPPSDLGAANSVTAPAATDAALTPATGSLDGTVTDEVTASPLGGVWVLAIGAQGIAGGAVTAGDGGYEITGLAPGTYRLAIVDPTAAHPVEYHADSPDYFGALPVGVARAETTTVDPAL